MYNLQPSFISSAKQTCFFARLLFVAPNMDERFFAHLLFVVFSRLISDAKHTFPKIGCQNCYCGFSCVAYRVTGPVRNSVKILHS